MSSTAYENVKVEKNVWGLQTATGFNHFNKDAAVMGSTVWQLFEDFMCMLVGVDAESQSQRVDDVTEPHGIQSGSAVPGARTVPLIPHVTNSRVLTSLASLMAGWLHRCHAVGRTTWPLAVERYGVLAGVTAGASLPPPVGSLPHAASVYRPVPPKVPPEFGRDLFGVLLEGIVQVPGVLEEDKEKGYRWLQGLADLAFEEEAYVKALKLYLQVTAWGVLTYPVQELSLEIIGQNITAVHWPETNILVPSKCLLDFSLCFHRYYS